MLNGYFSRIPEGCDMKSNKTPYPILHFLNSLGRSSALLPLGQMALLDRGLLLSQLMLSV